MNPQPPQKFGHTVTDDGRVKIVTILEANIDHDEVEGFKDVLERDVFVSTLDVILYLESVEYVSSIALGLISLASVMTEKKGLQFVVVCSHEAVLKLFVISGLYKAVKISNSIESARLKLAPSAPAQPSAPRS